MKLICKMRWLSLLTLCGAALLVGCGKAGPPTGTVSGSVTLEGQPVDSGEITFVSSEGFAASGEITGGQFTLKDPVPVGKYAVGVAPAALTEAPGEEGGNAAPPTSAVPAGYHLAGTSGISKDVQAGANTFPIELTESGPPKGNPMGNAP